MQIIDGSVVTATQLLQIACQRVADGENNTNAHLLANEGIAFNELDIVAMTNDLGISVASVMIANGNIPFTDNEPTYLLFKSGGFPEALLATDRGYRFTDSCVLALADDDGETIAHHAAKRGYTYTDPAILRLVDRNGISVADYVYKSIPSNPMQTVSYVRH